MLHIVSAVLIRYRTGLLAAAAVLAGIAVTVGPGTVPDAHAVSIDAECLGSFSRTFTPAVTLTPQTVTADGTYTYSTCVVGSTSTGTDSTTLTLGCIPVTAGPAETETLTWDDSTGGTSTISWSAPTVTGQTVVYTGTVTAGRNLGDTAEKITSGVSYAGSVLGCLLGTPISSTTGLVDSLLLTH